MTEIEMLEAAAAGVATVGFSVEAIRRKLSRKREKSDDASDLVREVIEAARIAQALHEREHEREHREEGKDVHHDEGQRRTAIRQRVERELANLKVEAPSNLPDLIE